MYVSLPKKNYDKKYRIIQLSNAGIDILNDVLLTLVLMMTMTSFLFATVNASHGNRYWAFLLHPNQYLKKLYIIVLYNWDETLALFLMLQNVTMTSAKDLYIMI